MSSAPGDVVGNLTREEWQAWQRNIEAQLDEYEQAIAAYAAWMADWRARQGDRSKAHG